MSITAQLAAVATVSQLRTAVKLEPRPDPDPRPDPEPSITKGSDERFSWWRIRLAHAEAAKVEAALGCHREALIAEWRHAHDNDTGDASERPPMPGNLEAFMRLIDAGWDADVAARPHGQRTTVVVHVDVEQKVHAALHLGPLLTTSERQFLTCDATCEVWFERHGQVIGAGRDTRQINRRLRRALEHRDRRRVVPAGLRRDPRSACASSGALGERRANRVGQPGPAVSVPSPTASPGWDHPHRTRPPARRH